MNGKVRGIEGIFGDKTKYFEVEKVVVSSGALNTPEILKNSGITDCVGENLFCDLFITVGGYLEDINYSKEIPMGVKSEFGPYFCLLIFQIN